MKSQKNLTKDEAEDILDKQLNKMFRRSKINKIILIAIISVVTLLVLFFIYMKVSDSIAEPEFNYNLDTPRIGKALNNLGEYNSEETKEITFEYKEHGLKAYVNVKINDFKKHDNPEELYDDIFAEKEFPKTKVYSLETKTAINGVFYVPKNLEDYILNKKSFYRNGLGISNPNKFYRYCNYIKLYHNHLSVTVNVYCNRTDRTDELIEAIVEKVNEELDK